MNTATRPKVAFCRLLLCLFFAAPAMSPLLAQTGGINIFKFLNLPASARITGLGGYQLTQADGDVAMAYANPALLNIAQHQQLSLSHSFFPGNIQYGNVAYGHWITPWKVALQGGVHYVNYGMMDRTDEFEQVNGQFKARENALTIGASKALYERLTVGINLRFISAAYDNYQSTAFSSDIGALYRDTASGFSVALVGRHLGAQLGTFRPDNRETLPFEMQLAVSQQLSHLPFRFSVVYRYLNRWNVLYDDPNIAEPINFDGETIPDIRHPWIENFFRHFVFNGEFFFGARENIRFRIGYNHMQRKELSIDNYRTLAGFSFGLGFKVKRFRLDYGRGTYHAAGSSNHLTIATPLDFF